VKQGGPMPIPLDEIVDTTRATLAVLESIRTGHSIDLCSGGL
jgi:hypothetical protein